MTVASVAPASVVVLSQDVGGRLELLELVSPSSQNCDCRSRTLPLVWCTERPVEVDHRRTPDGDACSVQELLMVVGGALSAAPVLRCSPARLFRQLRGGWLGNPSDLAVAMEAEVKRGEA